MKTHVTHSPLGLRFIAMLQLGGTNGNKQIAHIAWHAPLVSVTATPANKGTRMSRRAGGSVFDISNI